MSNDQPESDFFTTQSRERIHYSDNAAAKQLSPVEQLDFVLARADWNDRRRKKEALQRALMLGAAIIVGFFLLLIPWRF